MNSSKKLNYIFRRYPIIRFLFGLLIIGFIIGSIYLVSYRTKPVPEIEAILPPVGSPGDVVLIQGKNFGDVRDMSYVEIAGSKLTASSYISWSDTSIKLVLPASVQDGLVYVGTKDMRSKPALFANEVDIPVPITNNTVVSKPVIAQLSVEKASVGEEIVIFGNNFGDARNNSRVLFTVDYNNRIRDAEYINQALLTDNMVPASEDFYDYVAWTNTEIKVRVPDGACTGVLIVDTGNEKSDPYAITVNEQSGRKYFDNKKIYLVQYSADIADVVTNEVSTITLRCPVPYTTVAQPDVEITETVPVPILMNYQHNLIHQITKSRNNTPKSIFRQTFVLPVYEIQTQVVVDKVAAYKEQELELYASELKADNLVPSDDVSVKNLAAEIVGKEKNPYKKAKLIYEYLCTNFEVLSVNRKNDANPLDMLRTKKGDAYDFAVIYTALLRASGIPALTDSGVLVTQDLNTQSHWWCEFYIHNVGWIPVDPVLGAGLQYRKWTDGPDMTEKDFYFGNLDSHHILFSRGWNLLKPFSQENKIVQQPKSFALQSIWEEASSNTAKYSSYWSVPVIKGVY